MSPESVHQERLDWSMGSARSWSNCWAQSSSVAAAAAAADEAAAAAVDAAAAASNCEFGELLVQAAES